MARRSTFTFPQDPERACARLRELFPGWDIDYGIGALGVHYTAKRAHATGWSGTDGRTPAVVAMGMEMFEDAFPGDAR